MTKSSAGFRGGPSRIAATYRFGRTVSYSALLALLVSCGFGPTSVPPNAVVAATIPIAWKPQPPSKGTPTIVGARFSSLDVELGNDWTGDVITSTDVTSVVLHTNLFDIETRRLGAGRFHFTQHVVDDPAFIVRPYALDIYAIATHGQAELVVPFRLRGHGVR